MRVNLLFLEPRVQYLCIFTLLLSSGCNGPCRNQVDEILDPLNVYGCENRNEFSRQKSELTGERCSCCWFWGIILSRCCIACYENRLQYWPFIPQTLLTTGNTTSVQKNQKLVCGYDVGKPLSNVICLYYARICFKCKFRKVNGEYKLSNHMIR